MRNYAEMTRADLERELAAADAGLDELGASVPRAMGRAFRYGVACGAFGTGCVVLLGVLAYLLAGLK